jgi:cobaltochelatase CobT
MGPPGRERIETFQRAVAATCRAMAHRPALTVTFRAGEAKREAGVAEAAPGVRLPLPRRDMATADLARIRGEADGVALKLRHHDAKLHQRLSPRGEVAGVIFEALEQVRVEALGASRMTGVATNLASAHAARGRRPLPDAGKDSPDAGLSEAVELYALESLLGLNLPRNQRETLDGWRAWLESRTGQDWSGLRAELAEQEDFGLRVRELLGHLGLGEDLGEQPEEEPQAAEGSEEEQSGAADDAAGDGSADATDAAADSESAAGADESAQAGPSEERMEEANLQGASDEDASAEAPFQSPQYLPPGGRGRRIRADVRYRSRPGRPGRSRHA